MQKSTIINYQAQLTWNAWSNSYSCLLIHLFQYFNKYFVSSSVLKSTQKTNLSKSKDIVKILQWLKWKSAIQIVLD